MTEHHACDWTGHMTSSEAWEMGGWLMEFDHPETEQETRRFELAKAEIKRGWNQERRIVKWRAARVLITGHDDCESPFYHFHNLAAWGLRMMCLMALILNREAHDWDGYELGSFDGWNNGYGWSAQFIRFNPRTFRYEIYEDGDTTY